MAFRILYNPASDGDAATITSSSDKSNFPDDNAADDRVGHLWRTDGVSLEWIKWDLAVTSKKVDCITIENHNFDAGDTILLQGHTSDSWGSPVVSESITLTADADGNILPRITHYFTQVSLRWWRLSIDDASSGKSYFQLGRVMFGEYYEVSRDLSSDMRVERIDPSEGEKIPGFSETPTQKARFRRIRSTFQFITQTEADKWDAIFEYIGNSRPAVITWDTARPTKSSAYVYLFTPLTLAHQFAGFFDIMALVWEEKTR